MNIPSLPPLYFQSRAASSSGLTEQRTDDEPNTSVVVPQQNNAILFQELPAEVLHQCLVGFSTWGDLAKLACVQEGWKNLVADAADMSAEAKWDLAQALLHGTSGLEANPGLALQYLHQLSNVSVDEQTNIPIAPENNNDTTNTSTTTTPFAPAMREIANCYLNGAGVAQDSATGVAWLQASHTIGYDKDAAYQCAQIYEHGHYDTEIDVYAAFAWFEKAAKEADHVEAMAELALCYELGCGVEQSDEHALDWYMQAARRGHATAKYSVGEAFEEARGVPQSDEEACLWYYKAALDGDEDSRLALVRLMDIARIVVPGVGRLLDA